MEECQVKSNQAAGKKKKSKQKTPTEVLRQNLEKGRVGRRKERNRVLFTWSLESRILSQITKFTIEIEEMETKFFFKWVFLVWGFLFCFLVLKESLTLYSWLYWNSYADQADLKTDRTLLCLPPAGWQALGKPWQIRVLKRQALANRVLKTAATIFKA